MSKFNNFFNGLVEALDPVGKEDADINNDGKTDSTDDYISNKRRKIELAITQAKQEEEENVRAGHSNKHTTALEIWDFLLNKKKCKPSEAIDIINLAKAAFEHLL